MKLTLSSDQGTILYKDIFQMFYFVERKYLVYYDYQTWTKIKTSIKSCRDILRFEFLPGENVFVINFINKFGTYCKRSIRCFKFDPKKDGNLLTPTRTILNGEPLSQLVIRKRKQNNKNRG